MIWFTSDLHLSHKNILEYCERPFEDVHQMNCKFLENINNLVKPTDKLVIAGDLCFGRKGRTVRLLDKINCEQIYYIYGNHDKKNKQTIKEHPKVLSASNYLELKPKNNLMLVICHYPFLTWNKSHWNKIKPLNITSLNLFGHCHGGLKKHSPFQFDIGADAAYQLTGKYKPFSLEEIIKVIEDRISSDHPAG